MRRQTELYFKKINWIKNTIEQEETKLRGLATKAKKTNTNQQSSKKILKGNPHIFAVILSQI